ncbi:50ab560a-9b06-44be-8cb6-c269dff54d97, partial [Thermothielavioides terrestris]
GHSTVLIQDRHRGGDTTTMIIINQSNPSINALRNICATYTFSAASGTSAEARGAASTLLRGLLSSNSTRPHELGCPTNRQFFLSTEHSVCSHRNLFGCPSAIRLAFAESAFSAQPTWRAVRGRGLR